MTNDQFRPRVRQAPKEKAPALSHLAEAKVSVERLRNQIFRSNHQQPSIRATVIHSG
jgi:hypothetical protein